MPHGGLGFITHLQIFSQNLKVFPACEDGHSGYIFMRSYSLSEY